MRISVARTLAMVRTRWKQGAAFYNTPVTKSKSQPGYDPACRDCPRLAAYLDRIRQEHPDYHARPVAPFGPKRAALLVVGLAPGLHGANRTGRPFTGDHAGILLYRTLHRYGFASHEGSPDPQDGLALIGCRVTNAVKCLPPHNKPQSEESRGTAVTAAFDAQALLATLPGLPGVYRMIGAEGEALYVGKAGDLKKRVSSYFQKTQHGPRTAKMLTQVAAVEITVTRSEAEALILENNLIKSLAPRYNILFRDDKSYPYLMVSGGEFPRLGFHRGAMDKAHHYFGPFPHAGAVRESIQLLQRVFRLRTCEDSVFQNRSRPCLLYQIRRCTAPCVGHIAADVYAEDVKSAQLYLQGRSDTALKRLEVRMQQASDARRYEEAAIFRDQIQSLAKVSQRQYADTGADVDVDIIAVVMEQGLTCVNLMMVRGGRQLGDRSLFPQNAEERDAKEVLAAFIAQHYLERPIPAALVVGEELEVEELEATLTEHAKRSVRIHTRPTAERRAWLEMARQNALQALKSKLTEHSTQGT